MTTFIIITRCWGNTCRKYLFNNLCRKMSNYPNPNILRTSTHYLFSSNIYHIYEDVCFIVLCKTPLHLMFYMFIYSLLSYCSYWICMGKTSPSKAEWACPYNYLWLMSFLYEEPVCIKHMFRPMLSRPKWWGSILNAHRMPVAWILLKGCAASNFHSFHSHFLHWVSQDLPCDPETHE